MIEEPVRAEHATQFFTTEENMEDGDDDRIEV